MQRFRVSETLLTYTVAVVLFLFIFRKIFVRLRLSKAKHPSLRGHSKWSRRVASLIPFFEYDYDELFACDGAPEAVAMQRREGLERLRVKARNKSASTLEFSSSLEESVSDVQFTAAYRVPFPFRHAIPKELRLSSIVEETRGTEIKDIDGNWSYDLAGSYGVNVFGYDFYKECLDSGFKKVSELGPVLGAYHPLIRENVEKIRKVSGLDEVSFHMSGTEAVMQAVRLARYHTKRSHLVRLCGAYHGWWDGVQPGIGNTRKVSDVYTLSDLSEATLKVLSTRKDIACILINPMQAFHPNSDAAGDAKLVASDRSTQFDRKTYTRWLKKIRDICTQRGIVLIFDEVFTGFRLAYGGAQEYFGIQADMATYGKTLGGGLPVGVVCGKRELMKRFVEDRPANISFARGTFNSHPYVMAAMNVFLHRIEEDKYQEIYASADQQWNHRVAQLNHQLEQASLAIKISNMHSVLSVLYTVPSRFNWMFQFYLQAEGLELSWIGSGRFIMSLSYTDDDFNEVSQRLISAALKMQADGWWWQSENLSNQSIKHQMMNDMLVAKFPLLKPLVKASEPIVANADIERVKQS